MNPPDYWRRQDPNTPLYPDILWSRPQTKSQAGKLLIMGGNSFGFAAPALAYAQAAQAGVGAVRVLLPTTLQKTVGQHLPDADFAPTNPSGSFAATALEPLLAHAMWADAVLCAGDFGRNSQTAVVLEKFASKWAGPLTITHDAADYFLKSPLLLLNRLQTALVISYEQLQKYAMHAHFAQPITFGMDTIRTVNWLHDFTTTYTCVIVTMHNGNYFVAYNGSVVTQPDPNDIKIWRISTAARSSVFWMQNPNLPLEAIVSSLVSREALGTDA